eukprot:536994-Prymnesium_polylepis.2
MAGHTALVMAMRPLKWRGVSHPSTASRCTPHRMSRPPNMAGRALLRVLPPAGPLHPDEPRPRGRHRRLQEAGAAMPISMPLIIRVII